MESPSQHLHPHRLPLPKMASTDADDPYAALITLCECPADQKRLLRDLPFYDPLSGGGDSPLSPGATASAVASTPIIMVSPPDTFAADDDDEDTARDDFSTPPEEILPLTANSVEPMPPPSGAAAAADGFRNVEIVPADGNGAVDLGKDSDPDFANETMAGVRVPEMEPDSGRQGVGVSTRSKSKANREISREGRFTRSKSKGCEGVSGGERLSRRSKSKVALGEILGEKPSKKSMSKSKAKVCDQISGESPLKKSKFTPCEEISAGKTPKKSNVCVGSSGDVSLKKSRACGEKSTSGEKIKSVEMDANCEKISATEVSSEDTMRVDSVAKETQEGIEHGGSKSEVRASAAKNPDDIEKFKYVCPDSLGTSVPNLRRELPLSMHQHPSFYDSVESRRMGLKAVQDVLKLASVSKTIDDDLGHINLFEVALKCGMTFPRPRWWRPGGYRRA